MSVENSDLINRIYECGLILPSNLMLAKEFWVFQTNNMFHNPLLNTRYDMCPSLFSVGHTVFNEEKYHYLNIASFEDLSSNFPGHDFQTFEDMINFSSEPQIYLVENTHLLEGEDVLGYDYNTCTLVFLFICPSKPLEEYDLYSAEELTASFLNSFDYTDPHTRGQLLFHKKHVYRLIKIIEDILNNIENDADDPLIVAASDFYDIIEGIRKGVVRKNKIIENIRTYASANEATAKQFFIDVLDVAMRMRGWDGEKSYPLSLTDTFYNVNEEEVSFRLGQLYEKCCGELEKLGDLPILRYTFSQTFEPPLNDEIGQNIREKIQNILENPNIHACIRMSSNWLAVTSWYYMDRFFDIDLFPLFELSEIQ